MSIFNKFSTPVRFFRSFFFLLILVCCIAYFSQTISYAEEADITEEPTDKEENMEQQPPEEVQSDNIFTKNIYHQHTGSADGGGCYSISRTGTREIRENCNGAIRYNAATGTSNCIECGMGYTGNQSSYQCWHLRVKEVPYTYFDLGCDKRTDTLLGSLTVKKSTDEWAKSLVFTAAYEVVGDMSVSEKPYIWNGDTATDNNTYEVSNNGVYTLRLNADENANTAGAIISVEVKNVDVTGPVVRSHTQEPSSEWTKDGVLVTLTDVEDLQPDGSEGCGLHEMPYSYDGGENWTAENTCLYLENGTHSILVRDALENQSSYEVTFYNLDCFGPAIESVDYDRTKNIKDTVVTVTAKDIQPDGSDGIGLHDTPYSFDGGKTWTADNRLFIDKNGTISVVVRDELDNETYREEVVTNFDCMGPEITYKMEPASWTQNDVTIKLSAKDMNADGSDGIGLEENWYSLDNGVTWLSEKTLVLDENQTIRIMAKDKYNNRSSQQIKINQIDREAPWVLINMEQIGSGSDMKVKLTATAGDEYSGLHEKAYSWDMGCTYGTDNTKIVTENGTYQIAVRDKALNWSYALIEVDAFPIIEIPAFIREEKKWQTKMEDGEVEDAAEEEMIEEYVVQMEERIESPKTTVVQSIEEKTWVWKDMLIFVSFILLIAGLLVFMLLLWLRTIRIYAEDIKGNMKYMGRLWIRCKEEHLEVYVPMELVEKCMTTHFLLRPSILFAALYKEKDMAFLFPEEICVIKKVERNIEISLL